MNLRSDDRSQAIQIGAVLIFGVIILLFSSYQAFIVPDQNEEIEFDHHQEVQRDMVNLRSEILLAKTTGQDRYATVELGTQFPSRIIASNPGDPSGTLRTTDNRTIVVDTDFDGTNNLPDLYDKFEPENKFVEYLPNYAEFRNAGPLRYENTVLYKDFENTNVLLTNQRLVRDDTISLIPVHRDYLASGTQTAAIEPVPGILERKEVQNVNVTLGTNLTEADWLELFEPEFAENENFSADNVTVANGNLTLNLTGTFTIEYAPVGLDRVPLGGGRGDDLQEINPAAPGDIKLENNTVSGSTVTLNFNNTADANNITEARINFYDSPGGGGGGTPSEAVIRRAGESDSATLVIQEDFEILDPKIRLDGKDVSQVELEFDSNPSNNDWFVLTVILETGEQGLYFIAIDK